MIFPFGTLTLYACTYQNMHRSATASGAWITFVLRGPLDRS